MKRYLAAGLALILTLALVSCGAQAAGGDGPENVPEVSAFLPTSDGSQPDASQPEEDSHSHQLTEGDNTVPHDPAGYCGNTVTKVTENSRLVDDPKEASFWGSDSVALTDLLLYLDYSGDTCRCLPEYMVETEFGQEPYGVNLSEGYARLGDGQVELTREQVEQIREILERNLPD